MRNWEITICSELSIEENPEFTTFLENVELEDLTDNKLWSSKLRGVALVQVDSDIFPIRSRYGSKIVTGIGVNYASGAELWFGYPDIVAAKLLGNGKGAMKGVRWGHGKMWKKAYRSLVRGYRVAFPGVLKVRDVRKYG